MNTLAKMLLKEEVYRILDQVAEQAKAARNQAIIEAAEEYTLTVLGEKLGIARQRVAQIIIDTKKKQSLDKAK